MRNAFQRKEGVSSMMRFPFQMCMKANTRKETALPPNRIASLSDDGLALRTLVNTTQSLHTHSRTLSPVSSPCNTRSSRYQRSQRGRGLTNRTHFRKLQQARFIQIERGDQAIHYTWLTTSNPTKWAIESLERLYSPAGGNEDT